MINTNCSGTNAVRYGVMRDYVINLEVILSDGQKIKTAQRSKKSSAGYNLNHLFVGSEGTLGLMTLATLKLVPLPKNEMVLTAQFNDLYDATKSVIEIMQNDIPVRCVELLDDSFVTAINNVSNFGFTSN